MASAYLERRRRAREQHEEQEKASKRLDESNRKMKMSTVWKGLPIELTSMIIAQNALLPLELYGYTNPFGHHDHILAIDPEKWQRVRTALQICRSIRAHTIHSLKTHGAIEHIRFNSTLGPRGQRFEPSWWLLRHFRWVFINRDLWSPMAKGDADIDIFVTMPIPGAMRNVERIEHVRADDHRARSDDELEEQMEFWCSVAGSASWMFRTVGGWLMHNAAGDGSDIRRLISRPPA
ncbi:hypothetical protein TI39_contig4111g00021 [Zymoseptoria brevis]|uniref:Uncharacterized protein n=1 Tax=Zymoseptoria brevis TaxID=1047168 RepID=A0A0F4GDJ4_9PEZI|nr:hypothetical protein TI39_contig4111g00021 [Zymoseptoria brevis]